MIFNKKELNNYIFHLTGYRNFIHTCDRVKDGRDVIGLPISAPLSYVRRKLRIRVDGFREKPLLFHEFCHFIETEDASLLLSNFGLEFNSESSIIREIRVLAIQETLLEDISNFTEKSTDRFSFEMPVLPDNLPDFYQKDYDKKSNYRNLSWIKEKLAHNVRMTKYFS